MKAPEWTCKGYGPQATPAPVLTCMARCNVPEDLAWAMVSRTVLSCQQVVDSLQAEWDAAERGSCCKPIIVFNDDGTQDHYPPACEHLLRLWAARSYLALAKVNAPPGSYPCECGGTGVFRGHGYVENGVFKGHTGVCFRCVGKGYQTPADRERNSFYDNHVRRI